MANFLKIDFKEIEVIQGGDSGGGDIGFDIYVNGQAVLHRWGDEISWVRNGGRIPLNFSMTVFGNATISWHAWDYDFWRDDDAGSSTETLSLSDVSAGGSFRTTSLIRNDVSLNLSYGVSRGTDSSIRWRQQTGRARDIGVGADGTVWVIGTNPVGAAGDFGIYKMNGANWEGVDGGAVRISVGPDGMPWVINSAGQIFRRKGSSWNGPLPGRGKDIGVGADGSVWIVGTNPVGAAGDFGIYKWNGSNWDAVDGGAVRIAVGPDGNPWVVNSAGNIFRRASNSWNGPLQGLGRDIGVGPVSSFGTPNSATWLIGTDRVGKASDFGIYTLDGGNWRKVEGGGIGVAVGPEGTPWVVNSVGTIFKLE